MGKDSQHLNECKADQTLVWPFDVWLKNFLIPYIPAWIHPNHLTLASLLWIVCTCLASYLALSLWNIGRLWLIVLALFGHYITDLLDGELWRVRKAGYILWGFYMDHFLDYIFFAAIIGSLYFVVPAIVQGPFVVFGLIVSMLFVHLHIATIVQDVFLIAFHRIWPSEFRMIGVLFVIFVIYFPSVILPMVWIWSIVVFITLILALYTTQKALWQKDMENKMRG
jgi:phosphatidylglycerophosphate synthase